MGCFNVNGFISGLPITDRTPVVMFICADRTSYKEGSSIYSPLDLTSCGKFTPIALPFFGYYNDYGGIEDVEDDFNHQIFKDVIGMSVEEFVRLLHDLSNFTYGNMKKAIAEINEHGKDSHFYNSCHHQTVEDFTNMMNIIDKFIQPTEFTFLPEDDKMRRYEFLLRDHTCIAPIFERRDIYDEMVRLGKNKDNFSWGRWIDYEEEEKSFDITMKYINDARDILGDECPKVNPMTLSHMSTLGFGITCFGCSEEIRDRLDDLDFNEKVRPHLFNEHTSLQCVITHDMSDFALYNQLDKDFTPMKQQVMDFLSFKRSMTASDAYFRPSYEGSQEVEYNVVLPLYQKMVDILKEEKAVYDSYQD